jgi:hypothetical protein
MDSNECAAQALNHCPDHLVAPPVGIHNRAALKDFEKFFHRDDIVLPVHEQFRKRGDIAARFNPAARRTNRFLLG